MKRVAESQLTKDNQEDEEDKQAIRGLPKRAVAASATPSPPTEPVKTEESIEPTSRFGAFAGFGGSSPSSFTFDAPTPQPANKILPSFPSPADKLDESTPDSKPLSGTSLSSIPNPTPPSTPLVASQSQSKGGGAQKYCISLRGLNISFLDALTKAVQADPFVDMSEMLEKYRSMRSPIQKEFDASSSASTSNQGKARSALSTAPLPSMPAPPATLFGFGTNATAGPPEPHGGGFTPKRDNQLKEAPSSLFTWTNKVPSDASGMSGKSASSTFQFSPKKDDPVVFGKQASATLNTPFDAPASSFVAEKPNTDAVEPKLTISSETCGAKLNTPASFFFKPSAPTAPLTPGFSSFLTSSESPGSTGHTSTPPHAKLGSANPSPPSPSAFGFGTSKNSSGATNPFSFGKGNIANPVGFTFGSPPTSPNVVEPQNPILSGPVSTEGSLSIPSHDSSPVPSQGSVYDADGPGEEDEVTLLETKAKAYKLVTNDGKKTWSASGVGLLKLKKRMDGEKQRLLMRNSSTGQVILNFNLFTGFQINADKLQISFRVPGGDETGAVYRLRVPSETEAINWQKVVEKEVVSLFASHDK
ncbi:hypothetical protein K439DRAFT_772025 [Ramaria rubella]|nr:hypothetical protein K439DRAFT_772025 [Ramaria rubella]